MAKDKGKQRLYRIGEAAALMKLKTCVLRFWEDEFPQLEPLRTPKGQRLYREEDMRVLRRIRSLLYEKGMTIEGARRVLAGGSVPTPRHVQPSPENRLNSTQTEALSAVLSAALAMPSRDDASLIKDEAAGTAGAEAVPAEEAVSSEISPSLPSSAALSDPAPALASRLVLPAEAIPAYQASEHTRVLEDIARELRELRSLLS